TTTASAKPNELSANPPEISSNSTQNSNRGSSQTATHIASRTTYTIYINGLKTRALREPKNDTDKLDKEIKKLNATRNIGQFPVNTLKITPIYN
ncbi:unnamed protein product, partial [Fusarium fujikuroi]